MLQERTPTIAFLLHMLRTWMTTLLVTDLLHTRRVKLLYVFPTNRRAVHRRLNVSHGPPRSGLGFKKAETEYGGGGKVPQEGRAGPSSMNGGKEGRLT